MAEYNYQKNLKLWRLGSFGFKTPDKISYYYLKDYIGNIRVTVNEQGEIVTKDDYYPFGLRMLERSVNPDLSGPGLSYNNGNENDRLKFQSKRLQDYGFWETYYFGWRDYDPELGRWFVVDPARQFASPYLFNKNSPLNGYDRDGRVFGFLVTSGFISVVIDFGVAIIDWQIRKQFDPNAKFRYNLIDAGKSFIQGVALGGFDKFIKSEKFLNLGKIAYKFAKAKGWGWSIARGFARASILTSINIGFDVVSKDNFKFNPSDFVVQLGTQTIASAYIDKKLGELFPDKPINSNAERRLRKAEEKIGTSLHDTGLTGWIKGKYLLQMHYTKFTDIERKVINDWVNNSLLKTGTLEFGINIFINSLRQRINESIIQKNKNQNLIFFYEPFNKKQSNDLIYSKGY